MAETKEPQEVEYLNIGEAAAIPRYHKNTLYKAINDDPNFPVLRLRGGTYRIPRKAFLAYLAKRTSGLGAK